MYVNTGVNTSNLGGIGIMDFSTLPTNTAYLGNTNNGIGFGYDSTDKFWESWSGTAPTLAGVPPAGFILNATNLYMFAYDADNGNLWIGEGGTWWFGGNPVIGGTTGVAISGLPQQIYAGAVFYAGGPLAITMNYGSQAFSYAPPYGF
jgi:hypothetical protein